MIDVKVTVGKLPDMEQMVEDAFEGLAEEIAERFLADVKSRLPSSGEHAEAIRAYADDLRVRREGNRVVVGTSSEETANTGMNLEHGANGFPFAPHLRPAEFGARQAMMQGGMRRGHRVAQRIQDAANRTAGGHGAQRA